MLSVIFGNDNAESKRKWILMSFGKGLSYEWKK
jgi:hypothetical protein